MGKLELAKKLLSKIATPEAATALEGDARAAYLKALDLVHGPVEKRAAKMGFNTNVYHGTVGNLPEEFSLKYSNHAPYTTFVTEDPKIANYFADRKSVMNGLGEKPTVHKLKLRGGAQDPAAILKETGYNVDPKNTWLTVEQSDVASDIKKAGIKNPYITEEIASENGLPKYGAEDNNIVSKNIAIDNPSNLRAAEAAFDPRFKDSAKLMAGTAGAALALGAGNNEAEAGVTYDPIKMGKVAAGWLAKNIDNPEVEAIAKKAVAQGRAAEMQLAPGVTKVTASPLGNITEIAEKGAKPSGYPASPFTEEPFKKKLKGIAVGVPSLGATETNPLELLRQGADKLNQGKDAVVNAIADRFNVLGDPSTKEQLTGVLNTAADFAPGAPGLVLGASQMLGHEPEQQFANGGEAVDLRNFKKISEDDSKVILEHSNGHMVHLNKSALHEQDHKSLSQMPIHFKDGGDVVSPYITGDFAPEDKQSEMPNNLKLGSEQQPIFSTENSSNMIGQPAAPQYNFNQVLPQDDANAYQSQAAAQQQVQPAAPNSTKLTPQELEMRGIYGRASADSKQAQASAEIEQNNIQRQQEIQSSYAKEKADFDSQRDALMKDIQDSHIDPNKYWANLGTGGAISTSIGLILGGLSAGLTGKENPALVMMNKRLEQDLEAQKANLGKKESLLSAHFRKYGNLQDAMNASRISQNDIAASQLRKAAANAADPRARASALEAVGQLMAKNEALGLPLVQKTVAQGALQKGLISSAEAIPAIVPEKDRDNAFKELQRVNEVVSGANHLQETMKKAASLQSAGSRIMNPVESKKQIEALGFAVTAALKPILGVLSDSDMKIAENMNITFMDTPASIKTKMETMMGLSSKYANSALLDGYRIPTPKIQPISQSIKSGTAYGNSRK